MLLNRVTLERKIIPITIIPSLFATYGIKPKVKRESSTLFSQDYYPYIKKVESFDTETTSLFPYAGGKIFSWSRFDRKYCTVHRLDRGSEAEARNHLQRYLDDYTIAKTCHNVKFEIAMLLMNGFKIHPLTVWHDTMLMSQMLDNLKMLHGLDDLAYELAGWTREWDVLVKQWFAETGNYQLIPEHIMHEYQRHDAMRGMLLFDIFAPKILDTGMMESYLYEIEYVKVIQQMEEYGFMLHVPGCQDLIKWLSEELDKIQKETFNIFGKFVNPHSDDQVKWAFYDKFDFPMLAFTEGSMGSYKHAVKNLLKKGFSGRELKKKYPNLNPKVDKHVIFALQEMGYKHPFLDLVIKYRTYQTGRTTIRKSYLGQADSKYIVRANIKSNHDKTGRSAAEKPNIQNVADTKALMNPFPIPARNCWRARPGHFIDLVDFAQIELRLVIAICKDPILTDTLNKDGDTHNVLAAEWYHDVAIDNINILGKENEKYLGKLIRFADLDPKDKLRGKLRKSSKNANFGLPFGAQPDKLVKTLGLNMKYVLEGMKRIRETHPSYFNFAKAMEAIVKKQGYVETPFGRILWVDVDRPYSGANYIIQGTAAEVLKRSIVKVYRYYVEKWGLYKVGDILPCISLNSLSRAMPRFIAPIHDETLQEKPLSLLKYDYIILPEVSSIMTYHPELSVPMKVEMKRTYTTWSEAKSINLQGIFTND